MKKILCYGDSNTWGYIPGTGERYPKSVRWPCVAGELLGDEYEIIEDGINGRTTSFDQSWGVARNGVKGLDYALMAHYPLDGVVIMLGTNDLTIYNAAYAKKGMSEVLRIVKNANAYYRTEKPVFPNGVKILLIAPPLINEACANDPSTLYADAHGESKKFKAYYQSLAEENGVSFLDASEYAEASPIDSIHLTKESHIALGKAVAEKLKEMFQ